MKKLCLLAMVLVFCVSMCSVRAEGTDNHFDASAWLAEYEELMKQADGRDIESIMQEANDATSADEEKPAWYDKYVKHEDGEIVYDENGLHIVFFGFIEHPHGLEHGIADLLIINETGEDIVFDADEQYINSFEAMCWNGDVDLENGEYVYLKNEYNCMFDLEDLIKHETKTITSYKMDFTVTTPREEALKKGAELFSGTLSIDCDISIFDIWESLKYLRNDGEE